jgi:hypothetical protein
MFQNFLLNFTVLIIITILLFVKFNHIKTEIQNNLKEQGWNLYILDNCIHCKTQLEDIPIFKEYITYSLDGNIVDNKSSTDKNKILTTEEIFSFPLWYNTKTNKKLPSWRPRGKYQSQQFDNGQETHPLRLPFCWGKS